MGGSSSSKKALAMGCVREREKKKEECDWRRMQDRGDVVGGSWIGEWKLENGLTPP
jgi:hypothetical protein